MVYFNNVQITHYLTIHCPCAMLKVISVWQRTTHSLTTYCCTNQQSLDGLSKFDGDCDYYWTQLTVEDLGGIRCSCSFGGEGTEMSSQSNPALSLVARTSVLSSVGEALILLSSYSSSLLALHATEKRNVRIIRTDIIWGIPTTNTIMHFRIVNGFHKCHHRSLKFTETKTLIILANQ